MAKQKPLFTGVEGVRRRAIYKATGYTSDELARPHIGIVNAWSDVSPGHFHLRRLAEAVKAGIWQAGGTPFEFGTLSTCGAICVGTEHLRYELLLRDLVAASIETVAMEHFFDGLILLSSCDSIIAGQITGALRVDLPTLLVTGGPMLYGEYQNNRIVMSQLDDACLGGYPAGRVTKEELFAMEEVACPTEGACALLGTANTTQILGEVLGLALPGTATIPAVYAERYREAKQAGKRLVEMIKLDLKPSKLITKKTLENAITVNAAIGGSTNSVLHLLAFARELGIELTLNDFERLSRNVPLIVDVIPSGQKTVVDLHRAGGVPSVMKRLAGRLHLELPAPTGKTWQDVVAGARIFDPAVIRSLEDPVSPVEGLAVLTGSLAPDGAVARPSSFPAGKTRHQGPARVFDSDNTAFTAIKERRVKPGDVVVVRYEGPQGAPGMREIMLATDAICGMGLDQEVALVTDGRFSGFTHGAAVGHISPEAYAGGPLAVVRDGDQILIDLENRRLELVLPAAEIKERLAAWKKPAPKVTRGILALYARNTCPAHLGAGFP